MIDSGNLRANYNMADAAHLVVTDLNVIISPTASPPISDSKWHRIEKELYLYTSQQSAWLYVALANKAELRAAEDLVVVNICVGERPPTSSSPLWESRPCGIWVLRRKFSTIDESVTEVDVLFGVDAVDPRPQWALMQSPLQLDTQPKVPVARLSVLYGRAPKSDTPTALRVRQDGKFKILQIADTHMVTGVGLCRDAIDAHGSDLPESDADPLTVKFVENILDVEKPDLVVLTGDQLHHDIPECHTAILKVVAPMINRSIPFAAVFGNHDSEGTHALKRDEQISILQTLPFSFCRPGPTNVDGIGNYYLQVLAPGRSSVPLSTLYFLDSHGQLSDTAGYDHIKQSQIEWFTKTSQAARTARDKDDNSRFHLSLAFFHIPLPEFGDSNLRIGSGHREEPTEGPSINSHFYDALVKEEISAIGCGHDHVNDFCALLPQQVHLDGDGTTQHRPWLCHGGGCGFGGYCSYGKWPCQKRFHRRMRVWELDTSTGSLRTWKRVEYDMDRADELVLVANGVVVDPSSDSDEDRSSVIVNANMQAHESPPKVVFSQRTYLYLSHGNHEVIEAITKQSLANTYSNSMVFTTSVATQLADEIILGTGNLMLRVYIYSSSITSSP
ncbi:hypothetical protein V500_08638 [Pseudogymnoascus sp. VKM F-4518 (FW-2643)]|nr:hypothetical protein V500_08638 [Pseudogymnoascus sp. VKM F-4518 (FW-2643)]